MEQCLSSCEVPWITMMHLGNATTGYRHFTPTSSNRSTTPAIIFSPVSLTPLNNLSPVLLTPAINIHSRISYIFANFRKNSKRSHWNTWGARGTLIHEKNLKSKIWCQTPFNGRREGGMLCTVMETWKGGLQTCRHVSKYP
jgi:hypothetical protein